jgi:hypothetical protein
VFTHLDKESKNMRRSNRIARLETALLAAGCALVASAAHADVTVQEQSTFDLSLIKAHGSTTELTSGDKQRRDSELHCEGLMSLFCRNTQSGEIIRLDKDVTWNLDPKGKSYTENHFPTPAERQAAEAQMQAALEKLKQCPAMHQASGAPDASKCQMSPPKIEAHQTDKHMTIAGHDSRLSQLALTQSCHNPDTGDTCDVLINMDSWLTEDEIAGISDRKAFMEAHLKKLGLNDPNSQMQQQVRQFLAPYRDSLKELAAKSGEVKGYPLKTAFRISFGGAQCASTKNAPASGAGGSTVADAGTAAGQAAASSSAGVASGAAAEAASSATHNGAASSIFGSAASAFTSKLATGLFAKKASGGSAPAPAPDTPPNMLQVAQITIETTSISGAPVPADQFEVPSGWKLVTPKSKGEAKEFSCPTSGGT